MPQNCCTRSNPGVIHVIPGVLMTLSSLGRHTGETITFTIETEFDTGAGKQRGTVGRGGERRGCDDVGQREAEVRLRGRKVNETGGKR